MKGAKNNNLEANLEVEKAKRKVEVKAGNNQ